MTGLVFLEKEEPKQCMRTEKEKKKGDNALRRELSTGQRQRPQEKATLPTP